MKNTQLLIRVKSAIRSGNLLDRLIDFIAGNILFALPEHFRRLIFKGNSHYCPICASRLRTFINLYRPYHLWCPVCRSLQRHRLIWVFLNSKTVQISESPRRMLHFAPEPGLSHRFQSTPSLEYISADLNDPAAAIKLDICELPFPAEFFDLIYCSHVLEHVIHDAVAMQEFYRILNSTGKAVIQVPIKGEVTYEDPNIVDELDREKYFGQIDHVRVYGKDITQRLSKAGFQVKVFVTEDVVRPEEIGYMGLNVGETILLCEKFKHDGGDYPSANQSK